MQRQNIKKINGLITTIFLPFFIFMPIFAHALEASPVDGVGTGITYACEDSRGVPGNCDFNDLVAAAKKFTDYIAGFALMFSVVVIAYAGFKFMISGDVPKARTEARKMLMSVLMGIGFILIAWLIVSLITSQLLNPTVLESVPLGR